MSRLLTFIASGLFTLADGVIGVWATLAAPSTAAARETFRDWLIVITVLAIKSLVGYGWFDERERQKDSAAQAAANEMIAEMHAAQMKPSPGQSRVTISATGTVRNPTIAEAVKNGHVFTRFQREGIISLRAAGLQLAKLYRDFANKPARQEDITSTKYLTDFWDAFPFRELGALKDRLQDVLGFEVTSAAAQLPSTPDRIRTLARHLEKEASKVPADIPL